MSAFAIALCTLALSLARAPAARQVSEAPTLNQLHGVVVSRATGQPLAGVPVVMTHGQKGYLTIDETGLDGTAYDRDYRHTEFASHNARLCCDCYTGDDGSFTLLNFAVPDEPWHLAAGRPDVGIAFLANVVPRKHMSELVRIEIDPPSFIVVPRPAAPADTALDARVEIELVLPVSGAYQPAGAPPGLAAPTTQAATTEAAKNVPQREQPESRVFCRFYPSDDQQDDKVCRMGPLPPGFNYRVGRHVYGRRLSYHATEFERTVHLAPGATEHVSLEAGPGATISGRLTDTHDMPLADVNVTVRASDATGLVIGALSNQDGRYSLAGVPAGGYLLELLRHARPAAPT